MHSSEVRATPSNMPRSHARHIGGVLWAPKRKTGISAGQGIELHASHSYAVRALIAFPPSNPVIPLTSSVRVIFADETPSDLEIVQVREVNFDGFERRHFAELLLLDK